MSKGVSKRTSKALLAGVVVLLVAAALENFQQRLDYRLPDDGVAWVDSAAGVRAQWVDPQGPAAKVGIREGDLLLRIGDVTITQALDVPKRLDRIGLWRTARYAIVRDGQAVEKSLIVAGISLNTPAYYFLWLLGFVYLAIGAVVFTRHRRGEMVGHFTALCLASFVLYAFSYTTELDAFDRFIYWADVAATAFAPALFLHFCLVFPGIAVVSRSRRLLGSVVYLPATALLVVHFQAAIGALPTDLPLITQRILLDRIAMGWLGTCFVLGAILLNVKGSREYKDLVLRQQRKWLSVGTLWGVLPFAVFYLVPYIAGEVPGPNRSLSVFSLGLIPLAFAWAIARHRLMDVDLIVRRSWAYSLAAATLLAALYGTLFALGGWTRPQWAELSPAIWLVSLLTAALLFHPLRNSIQRTMDRRRYRERYNDRRTLVEFASELSTETDLDRILAALTERLTTALDVSRMVILVRDDGGFRLTQSTGMAPSGNGAISGLAADGLDAGFWEALASADDGCKPYLYLERPGEKPQLPEAVRRTLSALGLNYFVPCQVRGRVIALLGLGPTASGNYLSSEDLELVQAVCGYLAIALENIRLYDSLRKKVSEYERLKDYSENIVESISVGITAADLGDRVESWNTQLELLFGISRQQAVGRRLAELLPQKLTAELDAVRGETGIHNIYKFRLRAADFPAEFRPMKAGHGVSPAPPDEEERILNIAIAPLVAKNFDHIGRLIIFDDVSDRVELEEQLVQADKLSSIGLLAAGVAHEVNTPLAVISNYAQLLARQAARDPSQANMLQKITSQTFRASEIVNSLLQFSRVSNREFAELDLHRLLRDTLELVAPQLRQAQVDVKTDFDPPAARVRGNASKLQQVFLNLFLNARDAMPGGGTLTVRSRAGERDDQPAALVSVIDNGSGIAPEDVKRIFDPFFTTKGPKRGTGLGLAVSYGIIQEHSGTMRVESTPGRGTVIHIEVPLAGKPVHAQR